MGICSPQINKNILHVCKGHYLLLLSHVQANGCLILLLFIGAVHTPTNHLPNVTCNRSARCTKVKYRLNSYICISYILDMQRTSSSCAAYLYQASILVQVLNQVLVSKERIFHSIFSTHLKMIRFSKPHINAHLSSK